MLYLASALWVLVLIGLLRLGIPSQDLARDHTIKPIYYSLWLILLILSLAVHYHIMVLAGARTIAIISDILGVILYVFLRVLGLRLTR